MSEEFKPDAQPDETGDTEEFDPPVLEAGEELVPGYRVVAHLHRSNKFDVYDVYSEERTCRCVAKTPIPPDVVDDPEDEEDIEDNEAELKNYERSAKGIVREWNLLRKLTHPHVIRAYEVVRERKTVLITETLTGQTLSGLIDSRENRLPLPALAHLGLHLCSAIQYLHNKGILHLDLKPSNVVSERGMAKILDLSIARKPGRVKRGSGTLHYLSPEQAAGGIADTPADVWGIGAVLYEAATDELPFHAEDAEIPTGETSRITSSEYEFQGSYEQLERRAEPVGRHRRMPSEFGSIIDDCLSPAPEDRPTVAQVVERLEAFVASRNY